MSISNNKKNPIAKQGFFYGYIIVWLSFINMVVIWAAYYSFGVFFKPMIREFGWTSAETSVAFSLSAIISGLVAIAMGKFNDKFGPGFVMRICAIFLGSGLLLMSKVATVRQLFIIYGLILGIGMGGSFVPLMSTVARWFSKRRNQMTGIVAAGISIGALIGPPAANKLIIVYGWRMSYAILGASVLIIVTIATQFIKKDPREVGQHTEGAVKPGEKLITNISWEALSSKEAIHTRRFWVAFFMLFCLGFCTFTIIVHIAPHIIELRMPDVVAANVLAIVGGSGILGRVLMGRAADVIGSKHAFTIGFILMSVALLGLMHAKVLWIIFILVGLYGFANGTCVASQSPLVAVLFGLSSHGAILGFLSFGFTTGGGFGPWLAGYIFDTTGSYKLAFLMCAGVSLAGLVLTLYLKSKRKLL